jgi:hypothetical protein
MTAITSKGSMTIVCYEDADDQFHVNFGLMNTKACSLQEIYSHGGAHSQPL